MQLTDLRVPSNGLVIVSFAILALCVASCKSRQPLLTTKAEGVQAYNQTQTVDSLRAAIDVREQQIRELRLQLSATEKRAEKSERSIKEYDARGNLLKTDDTRTYSTTDSHLQAELSERDTVILTLNEKIVGLREELAKACATRQTSTKEVVTAYKVPAWCWWLLLANVLYVAGRILWAIYGKGFFKY